MEKDIIKNISIEDFKTNKNFVDYIYNRQNEMRAA